MELGGRSALNECSSAIERRVIASVAVALRKKHDEAQQVNQLCHLTRESFRTANRSSGRMSTRARGARVHLEHLASERSEQSRLIMVLLSKSHHGVPIT